MKKLGDTMGGDNDGTGWKSFVTSFEMMVIDDVSSLLSMKSMVNDYDENARYFSSFSLPPSYCSGEMRVTNSCQSGLCASFSCRAYQ